MRRTNDAHADLMSALGELGDLPDGLMTGSGAFRPVAALWSPIKRVAAKLSAVCRSPVAGWMRR